MPQGAALPYPGNQEFVAAYAKEFSHPPAVQSAGAYAGCHLLIDAIRRTGSLDCEKLREALLTLKTKTVFGDFAVDEHGYQTAHKAVTIQWQDGKQVVVWPDEVATGKARLPTPMWSTRMSPESAPNRCLFACRQLRDNQTLCSQ
jgi:branched-chain amino acid transport system substrate-binding protein